MKNLRAAMLAIVAFSAMTVTQAEAAPMCQIRIIWWCA